MVLCIAAPAWLYQSTGGVLNARNPSWALGVMVLAGINYAGIIASARRQLFAMVLWLFTYIFMGMAPYVQQRFGMTPGTTPYTDESLYPFASGLVIVCGVAFMIGGAVARKRSHAMRVTRLGVVNSQRANLVTCAAIAVFLYYGAQIGFASFLLSRQGLDRVRSSVWPDATVSILITGVLQMLLLVGFLAQMAVSRQNQAAGLRAPVMPALINGAVLLYAVNPISTPRYVFGTVALAMLAALGAYATITRFRLMAMSAMVGMVTIFPLADYFRYSSDTTVKVQGPVVALTSGDFDAFVQLNNSVAYVAAEGITYGKQLVGVVLLWVPRALWEGKPQDTGIELAEHMGYGFTNLSAPIWAELLVNFGWVGAIVGMGALGYLFRIWDARTDTYLRISHMPPVVVCAAAFYLVIFLRGSMLAVSAYLLVILVASWFVAAPKRGSGRKVRPLGETSRTESVAGRR